MPLTDIAEFRVSHLSILDEQGHADAELEPKLSNEELIELYSAMVLAREADSRMLKLQRQGRIGTFAPSTGQEAAICGPTFAMTMKDWFVGTYRELPGRLMRGESLEQILTYYNGYEEGSTLPVEARTFPTQVILGSQLPHAVGLAFAMKYQGEKDATAVAFFGDGASSQGDFHEAANFAAVWDAPVVFICVNNGWAISLPREKQTRSQTIAQKALAYGFEGVQVDGNDVLAMFKATQDALEKARAGKGPTLIEAVTYRLMMHTTADDPKKYREEAEEQDWWKRDPINRFRLYLEKKGIWNDEDQSKLVEKTKEQINSAVTRFEKQGPVKPDAPFDYVFGTSHEEIEAQRAEFLENLRLESANG